MKKMIGICLAFALVACSPSAPKNVSSASSASAIIKPSNITAFGHALQYDPKTTIVLAHVDTRNSVGNPPNISMAPSGAVYVAIEYQVRMPTAKNVNFEDPTDILLVDPAGQLHRPDDKLSGLLGTEPEFGDRLLTSSDVLHETLAAGVFEVPLKDFRRDTWYAVTPDGRALALQ